MSRTKEINAELINIENITIKAPPEHPDEINNIIAKILSPGFDTYNFLNKWKQYYDLHVQKEESLQTGGMMGTRASSSTRSGMRRGESMVAYPVSRIIDPLNMTLNEFITLQIHRLFNIDTSIDKNAIRIKLDEVLISKYGTSKYNDSLLKTPLKVLFRHLDNDKLEYLTTIIHGLNFENGILGSQKPNNYEWIKNKQSALFLQIFILLKTNIINEFSALEGLIVPLQLGGVRKKIILYGGTNLGEIEFDKLNPNFLNTLYKILIEIQKNISSEKIESDNKKYKNYIDNIIYCFKTIQLYNSKKKIASITFSIQSIIIRFIILSIAYINAHMTIEYSELINTVITLYILNLIDENTDFFCNYICMSIADIPEILPADAKQKIYYGLPSFTKVDSSSSSRIPQIPLLADPILKTAPIRPLPKDDANNGRQASDILEQSKEKARDAYYNANAKIDILKDENEKLSTYLDTNRSQLSEIDPFIQNLAAGKKVYDLNNDLLNKYADGKLLSLNTTEEYTKAIEELTNITHAVILGTDTVISAKTRAEQLIADAQQKEETPANEYGSPAQFSNQAPNEERIDQRHETDFQDAAPDPSSHQERSTPKEKIINPPQPLETITREVLNAKAKARDLCTQLEECTENIYKATQKVNNIAYQMFSGCHVYETVINYLAYKIETILTATNNVKDAAIAICDLTDKIDNIFDHDSEEFKDILSHVYSQASDASIQAHKSVKELLNSFSTALKEAADTSDTQDDYNRYNAATEVFNTADEDVDEQEPTFNIRVLFQNSALYGPRTDDQQHVLMNIPRTGVSDNHAKIDTLYDEAASIVHELNEAANIARDTGNEAHQIYAGIYQITNQEEFLQQISDNEASIKETSDTAKNAADKVNEKIVNALSVASDIKAYKPILSDDKSDDIEAIQNIVKYIYGAIEMGLVEVEYAKYGANQLTLFDFDKEGYDDQETWNQAALDNARSLEIYKTIHEGEPFANVDEGLSNQAHRTPSLPRGSSTHTDVSSETVQPLLQDDTEISNLTTQVNLVVDKLEKAKTTANVAGEIFSNMLCDLYNKPIEHVSTQIHNMVADVSTASKEAIKDIEEVEKYITQIANIIKDTDSPNVSLEDLKTRAIEAKVDYLIYANVANIAVRNLLLYVSSLYKQNADDADEEVAIVNKDENGDLFTTLSDKVKQLRDTEQFFKQMLSSAPVRIPNTEFTGGTRNLLSDDNINLSRLSKTVDDVVAKLKTAANTSEEVAVKVVEFQTKITKIEYVDDLLKQIFNIWETTAEAESAYDNAIKAIKYVNTVLEKITQQKTNNVETELSTLDSLYTKGTEAIENYVPLVNLAKNAADNLRKYVGEVFNKAAKDADITANDAAKKLTIDDKPLTKVDPVNIDNFKIATYNASLFRAIVLVLGSLPNQEELDANAAAALIDKVTVLTNQIKTYKIATIIAKKKASDFLETDITDDGILLEVEKTAKNVETAANIIRNVISTIPEVLKEINSMIEYNVTHHYELNLSRETIINSITSAHTTSEEAKKVAEMLNNKCAKFKSLPVKKKLIDLQSESSQEELNIDQIKKKADEIVKRITKIIEDSSSNQRYESIRAYIDGEKDTIMSAFKDVNNLINAAKEIIKSLAPLSYLDKQNRYNIKQILTSLTDAKQELIEFIISTRTEINNAVNPAIRRYATQEKLQLPSKRLIMKVLNIHNLTYEDLEEVIKEIHQGTEYLTNVEAAYKKVTDNEASAPTDLLFAITEDKEEAYIRTITQQHVDIANDAAKDLNTKELVEKFKIAVEKVKTHLEEMKNRKQFIYEGFFEYVNTNYDDINAAIIEAYYVGVNAEEVIEKMNEIPIVDPNPFETHWTEANSVVTETSKVINEFLDFIYDIRQTVKTNIDTSIDLYRNNDHYQTLLGMKPPMESVNEDHKNVLADIINGIEYIKSIERTIQALDAPTDGAAINEDIKYNITLIIQKGKEATQQVDEIRTNIKDPDNDLPLCANYVVDNENAISFTIDNAMTISVDMDTIIEDIGSWSEFDQEPYIKKWSELNETLDNVRSSLINLIDKLKEILTKIQQAINNFESKYPENDVLKRKPNMDLSDEDSLNYRKFISHIIIGIVYINELVNIHKLIDPSDIFKFAGEIEVFNDDVQLADKKDPSEAVYEDDFENESEHGDKPADPAANEENDEESDEESDDSVSKNLQDLDDQSDRVQEGPSGQKPQDVSFSQLIETVKPVEDIAKRKSGSIIDRDTYIKGIRHIYDKLVSSGSNGKKVIEQIKSYFEDTKHTGYDVENDLCIGFYVCYIFFDKDIKDCYNYIQTQKDDDNSLYKAYIIYKFLYKKIFNIPLIDILFYYIQNICKNKTIKSIEELKELLTSMHNIFEEIENKTFTNEDIQNIMYDIKVILHLYARLSNNEFTFNQSRIYEHLKESEEITHKQFINWDQTNCIYNFAYYYSILSIYSVKEILELYKLIRMPINFVELLQSIVHKIDSTNVYINRNVQDV